MRQKYDGSYHCVSFSNLIKGNVKQQSKNIIATNTYTYDRPYQAMSLSNPSPDMYLFTLASMSAI